MEGKVKLCTSSIKIEQKNIYLLATFQLARNLPALDTSVIAEASLSLDYPIIVIIGKARYTIGSKEEFLHRRLAIQAARQRLRQGACYNKAQHGKSRKFKALDHYKTKEKDYINHKLHLYSRRLIDICIKHQVATLMLVNQQSKEEAAKTDEFLLRNWSYHTLKEKILYKAAKAGIEVIVE